MEQEVGAPPLAQVAQHHIPVTSLDPRISFERRKATRGGFLRALRAPRPLPGQKDGQFLWGEALIATGSGPWVLHPFPKPGQLDITCLLLPNLDHKPDPVPEGPEFDLALGILCEFCLEQGLTPQCEALLCRGLDLSLATPPY